MWTADGKRLIYEGQNFELMWAPADRSNPPSVLAAPGAGRHMVPTTEQLRNEIAVVLNWFEELRRKAPLPE